MEIRNRKDVEFIDDTCGVIQELFHSDNISLAYVIVKSKARSHMHRRLEEIYYIQKGGGKLYIGIDCFNVKPEDIISIPKNIYHHLERTSENPLELLVVTYPRYDPLDVIEEEL